MFAHQPSFLKFIDSGKPGFVFPVSPGHILFQRGKRGIFADIA